MSALKSCELDFNNTPPVAQMIVSVNGVPLGTQGNLLCITGKGKDEVFHLPISKSMFMAYPYPV